LNCVEALFLVLLAIAIVLGIWVAITGCHDGCQPESMRCRGDRVEVCNADQDWYVRDRCDTVEPVDWNWVCCWVPDEDLYACVPEVECEADGGTP